MLHFSFLLRFDAYQPFYWVNCYTNTDKESTLEVTGLPNRQLAENLRYLRKKNGLNQDDMNTILNISRQSYSNYENCKRTPDLDTLVRLSRHFKISLDDLLLRNLRTLDSSFDSFDSYEGIREASVSYPVYAECQEDNTSVYLTLEEMNFIMGLRFLPDDKKQIVKGFVNYSKPE